MYQPFILQDSSLNKYIVTLFLFFQIPFALLIIISQNHVLAFDSMQFGGAVPNYIFDSDFENIMPPNNIDSGHPPGFALYIASLWQLFGRSLIVSHWAIYPIVLVTIYQILFLCHQVFKENKTFAFLASCALLFQATIVVQTTQVSPDNVVIAFSLLLLNGVLFHKSVWITIAVLVLGCTSVRGMSIAILVWLVYFIMLIQNRKLEVKDKLNVFFKSIAPFLLGGIIGGGYLLYHYIQKGWVTPDSTTSWGAAFEMVSFRRILVHQLMLVWRMIDIGAFGITLLSIVLIIYALVKKRALLFKDTHIKYLSMLLVLVFVFTIIPLTFYQGLLSHRYLIVFSTLLLLLGLYLLYRLHVKYKYALLVMCILVQLTGHFWRYPQWLSVSWDCTLSHFGYYTLRDEFIAFIKEKNISYEDIYAGSPLQESAYVVSYINSIPRLNSINEHGIGYSKYIWYSNVSNDMKKKKIDIEEMYKPLLIKNNGAIEMILYEKL